MPMMRGFRLSLLPLLIASATASAQVRDSDTEREMRGARPDVFDLITGQFPRHGRGYYEIRAIRREARLTCDLVNPVVRNDLAAACLELGLLEKGRAVLRTIESLDPGRPEVLYNLGTCSKLKGDFREAMELVSRAGGDDLELKMLAWRTGGSEIPDVVPIENFLGVAYREWSPAEGRSVDSAGTYDRLLALLVRDPEFADACVVLGDELYRRGAPHLAVWSWVRALHLGHPCVAEIRRRLDVAFFLSSIGNGRDPDAVDSAILGISRQLDAASEWVRRFQKIEYHMALEGRDADFAAVAEECAKRGVRKVGPGDFRMMAVPPAELAAAGPQPERNSDFPAKPPPAARAAALRALLAAAVLLAAACLVPRGGRRTRGHPLRGGAPGAHPRVRPSV